MIMPLLAGLIVFYFTPFFQNVFYSFTDLGEFQIWTTISLDNYINLFSDDEFRSAIYNTLAYVFICVPIITVLSLLLCNWPESGDSRSVVVSHAVISTRCHYACGHCYGLAVVDEPKLRLN